jgi:hypothetical protein
LSLKSCLLSCYDFRKSEAKSGKNGVDNKKTVYRLNSIFPLSFDEYGV